MGVSDVFLCFSARGRGRGSPRAPGGGVRFFSENPTKGGGFPGGAEGSGGKTETPQTVTLQVTIELRQKAIKNQHTVPDHVLAYRLRRNFLAQKSN